MIGRMGRLRPWVPLLIAMWAWPRTSVQAQERKLPDAFFEWRLSDAALLSNEESPGADRGNSDWLRQGSPPFASPEEMREFLVAARFGAVILWLPLAQADLPKEPSARFVTSETLPRVPGSVAALVSELHREGILVAIGRSRALEEDWWSPQAFLGMVTLPRVSRPGSRRALWFDPEFCRNWFRDHPGSRYSVPGDLVRHLPTPIATTQARLDALAFHQAAQPALSPATNQDSLVAVLADRGWTAQQVEDFSGLLLDQSRCLSEMARRFGRREPHRFHGFANEWIGTAPARDVFPTWRTAPSSLDLAEWAFQKGSVDTLANGGVTVWNWPDATAGELRDPRPDGLLPPDAIASMTAWFENRWSAAVSLSRAFLEGDTISRNLARVALQRSRRAARSLPEEWRPNAGLDQSDDQILEQLEPVRGLRTRWSVWEVLPEEDLFLGECTSVALDDGRYGDWAEAAVNELGQSSIPLRQLAGSTAARTFLLRATLEQPQSRASRLSFEGDAVFRVLANGRPVGDRIQARASLPITTTVVLPPGQNVLEIELQPTREVQAVTLQRTEIPRRLEAIPLTPQSARTIHPPMVRVTHPVAFDDEVFLLPAQRRSEDPLEGQVDFVVDTGSPRRWDLWIHGAAPEFATGVVEVEFDEGPRRPVSFPPRPGWQWRRCAAPISLSAGNHRLRLSLQQAGMMFDAVALLESGPQFPHPPPGDQRLIDFAWRFDVLGAGHRFEIPAREDLIQRSFRLKEGGRYDVYVWMHGTRPLAPGEVCEIELTCHAGAFRHALTGGVTTEEWIRVGSLPVVADEPLKIRIYGPGSPAYLCLVP